MILRLDHLQPLARIFVEIIHANIYTLQMLNHTVGFVCEVLNLRGATGSQFLYFVAIENVTCMAFLSSSISSLQLGLLFFCYRIRCLSSCGPITDSRDNNSTITD